MIRYLREIYRYKILDQNLIVMELLIEVEFLWVENISIYKLLALYIFINSNTFIL